jgi:hypothetical protein
MRSAPMTKVSASSNLHVELVVIVRLAASRLGAKWTFFENHVRIGRSSVVCFNAVGLRVLQNVMRGNIQTLIMLGDKDGTERPATHATAARWQEAGVIEK